MNEAKARRHHAVRRRPVRTPPARRIHVRFPRPHHPGTRAAAAPGTAPPAVARGLWVRLGLRLRLPVRRPLPVRRLTPPARTHASEGPVRSRRTGPFARFGVFAGVADVTCSSLRRRPAPARREAPTRQVSAGGGWFVRGGYFLPWVWRARFPALVRGPRTSPALLSTGHRWSLSVAPGHPRRAQRGPRDGAPTGAGLSSQLPRGGLSLVLSLVACRPRFPRSRLSCMAPDSRWGLRRQATSDKDRKNRPPGGDPSAPRSARLRERGGYRVRTRVFQRGSLRGVGLGIAVSPPRRRGGGTMSK